MLVVTNSQTSSDSLLTIIRFKFSNKLGCVAGMTACFQGMQWLCMIRIKKTQSFFLSVYFNNHHLHVSNGLAIRHQEVVYCMCSISYLLCICVV